MNRLYKYTFIPHNYIAEEIFLGIILIYPEVFHAIKNIIKKEYFFLETNQIIYLNLLNISEQNKNNIFELLCTLQNNKILLRIGGLEKIIQMMRQSQIFISSSKINKYFDNLIQILNDNYLKRLVIQFGYNIIRIGYIKSLDNYNLFSKILSYIYLIETQINKNKNQTITNIKDLVAKKLLELKYQNIYLKSIKTRKTTKSGFFELDSIITNLPIGNLIIIAGRPSIGKTSFAINIAYNICFYQQTSLLIFSLEMSNNEVFNKLLSIASEININQSNITNLDQNQWKTVGNICNTLLKNNIYINDQNNIDIDQIARIAKNLKKKTEYFDLIIIDYLQLIEFYTEKSKKYSRSQELGYITRRLKILAQFLKLPIIVISQLNRNIETRSNKEPLLSDLKESGCIKSENNISIESKQTNNINIKNKTHIKIRSTKLNNAKQGRTEHIKLKVGIDNIIKLVNLSNQYIFKCNNNINWLSLTHHHRYLSQNIWIKTHQISLLTTINITTNNTKYLIHRNYIHDITFDIYSKSYDLNQNEHFNLISQEIITHNSIEQDADIILVLYEQQNTTKNFESNNSKTIDLKICKNRNGNVGYCKLQFLPEISVFKNTDIRTKNYFDTL
uniref:Replication helicase subunit n=1 Tax=Symphyocladia marchantioides TaxID=88360 RepID=UPI0022FD602F|nr:Replication helicase subunit [Symphyocladia marchantioides]WAX03949.1 Replication helicase subunit [Symphyocladia marchantioides]